MFLYLIGKSFVDIIENFTKIVVLNSVILLVWGIALALIQSLSNGYSVIVFTAYIVTLTISYVFSKTTDGKSVLQGVADAIPIVVSKGITVIGIMGAMTFYIESEGSLKKTLLLTAIWILAAIYMAITGSFYNNKSKNENRLKERLILFFSGFRMAVGLMPIKIILIVTNVFIIPGVGAALYFERNIYELIEKKRKWLSDNNGKEFSWDEALSEEKKRLEEKDIIGMLFPWKNGRN